MFFASVSCGSWSPLCKGDEDVLRSLVPYRKTEQHPERTLLFRQGDAADRLYLTLPAKG